MKRGFSVSYSESKIFRTRGWCLPLIQDIGVCQYIWERRSAKLTTPCVFPSFKQLIENVYLKFLPVINSKIRGYICKITLSPIPKLLFQNKVVAHSPSMGFLWQLKTVKNPPAVRETWVRSLSQEDTLEKGMTTHSSILAWIIPWTEEPGRLQSTGSQRVREEWVTNTLTSSSTQPTDGNLLKLQLTSILFLLCLMLAKRKFTRK